MKTNVWAAVAASLMHNAVAQQFVMYSGSTKSNGDDTTVQRIDPILSPGKIGQHVHEVFGSNALAPEVTYDSLQNANCTTLGDAGGSNGNAADKSIYWHPALYMEASDGSGYVRVPSTGHKLYYQKAGSPNDKLREPFEFPHGFRMIAGNPWIRSPPANLQSQNVTQWICHDSSGDNQGTSGGFPTGVTSCDAYPFFNGAIHFPHCWNGADFDPKNPAAHVSYPTGDVKEGICPSSHPTRLPHIFIENAFDFDSVASKVKQDSFVLAQGDNTGLGWHADFFNGWKDGALPTLFDECPQGEYGNEDIGSCSTFDKSETPTDQCTLQTFYTEKVDAPGKLLPGCNPVRDSNPAPIYETAPLGTYSDRCKVVPGSPGSGGNGPPDTSASSAAPAPYSMASSSSMTSSSSTADAAMTSQSASSPATMATYATASGTTTSTAESSTSTGSKISCPGSHGQTTTVNGKSFTVECGTDHSGGNLKMVYVKGLQDCVEQCASTDGCVDVSLSGTACYMKKTLGQSSSDAGVNGAKLVTGGSKHRRHSHVHRRAHERVHI